MPGKKETSKIIEDIMNSGSKAVDIEPHYSFITSRISSLGDAIKRLADRAHTKGAMLGEGEAATIYKNLVLYAEEIKHLCVVETMVRDLDFDEDDEEETLS